MSGKPGIGLSVTVLYIVALSIISGLLYAAGGHGKPFNTKYRDFGVPTCAVVALIVLGYLHWSLILVFGALFGSMTTYHKWVSKLFYKPWDGNVKWPSWAFTGFTYGLSLSPILFVKLSVWPWLIVYCLLTTILTAVASELIGKRFWEEFSRGFIVVAGLIIFSIHN